MLASKAASIVSNVDRQWRRHCCSIPRVAASNKDQQRIHCCSIHKVAASNAKKEKQWQRHWCASNNVAHRKWCLCSECCSAVDIGLLIGQLSLSRCPPAWCRHPCMLIVFHARSWTCTPQGIHRRYYSFDHWVENKFESLTIVASVTTKRQQHS